MLSWASQDSTGLLTGALLLQEQESLQQDHPRVVDPAP
jgi:hypothetical protein